MLAGLAPGSVVGGFRVESRLGAGGMAVVFQARDEGLDRVVALKVLAPALARDEAFRERFIRESRAAARVDHPHVIPVHAAGEDGGVLYLAMRFVPGGDLRSVIAREGPLSGERAVALLSPLASALDAAHAAGLVHRDVKSANILIDTSPGRPDHPYLSDFGLAKVTSSAALTETGQFLGTSDYAAPEQISDQPAGPATDQYALACVAYTMLSGSLPFARSTTIAVLRAHMHDSPPPLSARRRDLPPAVDGVLNRALAKAPAQRFASCGEFAAALRAALGPVPCAVSRPGPANPDLREKPAGPGGLPPVPAKTAAPHPSFPSAPGLAPAGSRAVRRNQAVGRGKQPASQEMRRKLLWRAAVAGATGVVAGVIALVAFYLQPPPATSAVNLPQISVPSPAASGTVAQIQRKAAAALSGLLTQSADEHAGVSAAVVDVEECGPNLAKDPQVFNQVSADRHALLTKLAQLPGRATLSPVMIADLNGGWQASATLDADLAKWGTRPGR
jgi:serine/threonine-protein kinase